MKTKRLPDIRRLLPVIPALLMALSASSCDGRSALVLGPGGAAAPQADDGTAVTTVVESQAIAQIDAQFVSVPAIAIPAMVAVEAPAVADPELPVASVPIGTQSEGLLAAVAAQKDIRVMAMGDSITQGVGGATSYRYELTQLIAEGQCPMVMVGTQSESSPEAGFYSPHEGYTGHTADNFIAGDRGSNEGVAFAVDSQKPDVVLLHVGSVDISKGHGVASTIAEIDQIISIIHATKPDTLVFIANVIPWMSTKAGSDRPALIEELGDQIELYVNESTNPLLYVVDVRSGYSADMMQSDLIHPNEAGDAHIADAFFHRIYSSRYCN